MEKFGFIYLWFDRKHKRYYLGKHWGTFDDGYICSSTWMKQAYRLRPDDFGKRRILEIVTTSRKDLADAEDRWGAMIKEEELGNRYYNLVVPKHRHWSDDPDNMLSTRQKISKARKGKGLWPNGRSEEDRAKMSETRQNNNKKRLTSGYVFHPGKGRPAGFKHSNETKAKMTTSHTGKKKTPEECEAQKWTPERHLAIKEMWTDEKRVEHGTKLKWTDERREAYRIKVTGKKRGPYKKKNSE